MNTRQARQRVAETFPQPFNKGKCLEFTRILLGVRKHGGHATDGRRTDGVSAMVLLLDGLLLFSVWLPAPLLALMHQAAGIIGGKR